MEILLYRRNRTVQETENPIIQIITDRQLYLIGKIHTVIRKLEDLKQQYSTVEQLISSKRLSKDLEAKELQAK